jgi:hypothetical protein
MEDQPMDEPMNASPTTTRVEQWFYIFARWFLLIITVTSLGMGFLAVFKGFLPASPSRDSPAQQPIVTYDDFRRIMESSQEQKAADEAAKAELQRRLDAIVMNLIRYAEETKQPTPSAQEAIDKVRSAMEQVQEVGNDDSLRYISGLESATNDLAADGQRLSRLQSDDDRRAQWDKFVDWYTNKYMETPTPAPPPVPTFSSGPDFGSVALYFFVFIVGIFLLVLLRIELNTRPSANNKRNSTDKT